MFVFLCFIPLILSFGIPLSLILDKLVSTEYEKHHEEWQNDGGPIGFLWKPPEYGWVRGMAKGQISRERCLARWLRHPPAWIEQDTTLLRLLRSYRVLRWLFWCSLVIAVFVWGAYH